jgi:hypothetical protein
MPTKHIDEKVWRQIEKKAVDAVIQTKLNIKDTEMLKWLIIKGLETIREEDYYRMKNREPES